MRDPLQPPAPPSADPYEILGVAPSARRSDLQAAYRARLKEGADPQVVFDAKKEAEARLDPTRRPDENPYEYDEAVLRRLGTTHLSDLLPPGRAAVLREWDAVNTAAFPDRGAARALGICSYWSAVHVLNGGQMPGWDLTSLWRLAAMCCAMTSPEGAFRQAIARDLEELAHQDARYEDLVAFFSKELETVDMIAAVRLRTRDPEDVAPLAGVGMLKHVGWLEKVERQVRAALEKKKGHPVLEAALQMLVAESAG